MKLHGQDHGEVKGHGVPVHQLTFGLLVFPEIWDWHLYRRERRRGFHARWECGGGAEDSRYGRREKAVLASESSL